MLRTAEAEKSDNFSLGLVLQPADRLYITIDAYRIELEDRISLSENLTSAAVRNFLNANGFVGVGGGRYFTATRSTPPAPMGIDIVGTYRWDIGEGSFDLTAGYNHNETEIDRIAANPGRALAAIDPNALRFGRVEIGRFEVGAPKDKFLLGGVWKTGNWEYSANATRYGEITIRNASPAQDQTFDSKRTCWTWPPPGRSTSGASRSVRTTCLTSTRRKCCSRTRPAASCPTPAVPRRSASMALSCTRASATPGKLLRVAVPRAGTATRRGRAPRLPCASRNRGARPSCPSRSICPKPCASAPPKRACSAVDQRSSHHARAISVDRERAGGGEQPEDQPRPGDGADPG